MGELFTEVFNWLPLAHLIQNKILVCYYNHNYIMTHRTDHANDCIHGVNLQYLTLLRYYHCTFIDYSVHCDYVL